MNKKRKIVVNEDLFLDVLKNRVDGLIDFHFFRSLEKQDLLNYLLHGQMNPMSSDQFARPLEELLSREA